MTMKIDAEIVNKLESNLQNSSQSMNLRAE